MTDQRERPYSVLSVSAASSPPDNLPTSSLQDDEVASLRQQLETLQAEFAAFRAAMLQLSPESPVPVAPTDEPLDDEGESEKQRYSSPTTSRRRLLKWGGLGAAAALAATGGATLASQTARAADGDDLVLGTNNTAEHGTTLTYDGSEAAPLALTIAADGRSNSTGIGAFASYLGVFGMVGTPPTSSSGRFVQPHSGMGPSAIGTYGFAYGVGAAGAYGGSDSGFGVLAESFDGVALAAIGTGRIWQLAATPGGPPTTGNHSGGEQIRDDKGDMYICIASGSPGKWRKVAAGIPGVSGAINFLANPIRLLDTRTGSAWVAGSIHTLQVTGVSVSGVSVPIGAIGVIGNVTVVGPTGSGDLRLYPGATAPNTSSINFASGQIIANGVTVGLNGSGKFNIKVDLPAGTHTHVLFDASGFIL